jgi:hypothetical protein
MKKNRKILLHFSIEKFARVEYMVLVKDGLLAQARTKVKGTLIFGMNHELRYHLEETLAPVYAHELLDKSQASDLGIHSRLEI